MRFEVHFRMRDRFADIPIGQINYIEADSIAEAQIWARVQMAERGYTRVEEVSPLYHWEVTFRQRKDRRKRATFIEEAKSEYDARRYASMRVAMKHIYEREPIKVVRK